MVRSAATPKGPGVQPGLKPDNVRGPKAPYASADAPQGACAAPSPVACAVRPLAPPSPRALKAGIPSAWVQLCLPLEATDTQPAAGSGASVRATGQAGRAAVAPKARGHIYP